MKKTLGIITVMILVSCGGSKKETAKEIKEIVCGDSIEQILYSETGVEYTMRVPGKCDTIYVSE